MMHATSPTATLVSRTPPHAFFLVSAVFHYLGPAFAVLLFAQIAPLGVAWLRIASAAAIFALWRKPWRLWKKLEQTARPSAPKDSSHLSKSNHAARLGSPKGAWRFATLARSSRLTIIALGVVLAAMNSIFYLAIARLPLSTVGAIEFLGPIALAAIGMRTKRNVAALLIAVAGVYVLTDIRIIHEPLGFLFAFANCALFILYVALGHRIADTGSGIDGLALSMLIAAIAAAPIGFIDASPALTNPTLLAAAIGVGVSSSVIPYVCDQLAMARLKRSTFALLLSILPASAVVIGALVLHQIPSFIELIGIALVILGVALHRETK